MNSSEALRLPTADGVNVTLTAQAPLGVNVAPVQVSALLPKSLAFAPPIATAEMVRLAVPVLVTVSIWAVLVVLTGSLPKLKPGADKLDRRSRPGSAQSHRLLAARHPIVVVGDGQCAGERAGCRG